MGGVNRVNDQSRRDYTEEDSRQKAEYESYKKDVEAFTKALNEIEDLSKENNKLQNEEIEDLNKIAKLNKKKGEFKYEKKQLEDANKKKEQEKVKIKNQRITNELTLSKFLENINFYQKADPNSNIFYKGVLINSFYELEFEFPYADTDINNILKCRCVSIGIPNIRKNYTSLNFNGRRVEIEQNTEFQHEIQLRIICDDEADIYYKFKEYIDFNATKKPKTIFNNSKIYICLNGFKTIELNHITISDLGQLEFDNGPNSNICFFNVTLKIIDYKFIDIVNRNEYDKLTFEILENNKKIKTKENEIKTTQNEIDKQFIKINEKANRRRENNETIRKNKEKFGLENIL